MGVEYWSSNNSAMVEVAGFWSRFLNTDSDLEHAAFVEPASDSVLIVVIVESVEKCGELIQIVTLRKGIGTVIGKRLLIGA